MINTVTLVKEEGIWVYHTGAMLTAATVKNITDQIREDRITETVEPQNLQRGSHATPEQSGTGGTQMGGLVE